MSAKHRAVMNTRSSEPVPGSPAAHLAAAQADAERMFGDAPMPVWNPPARWKTSVAGAGAAMLVAAGAWWWFADAPEAVVDPAPRPSHATAPIDDEAALGSAGTAIHAAAPTPGPVERSSCDNTGACRNLAMSPPVEPQLAAALADPQAWALHPQPWRAVDPPSFVAAVNTPPIPDENDTTPGEERSPDNADAATQSNEELSQ